MDKYKATSLEILMKLYSLDKPIHCSFFAEEYNLTGRDFFSNLHFLMVNKLVERLHIYKTEREAPFYKLSEKGKTFIEEILDKFPLIRD